MQVNSKKFMVLLVVLAIALLPIRLVHATGGQAHVAVEESNSSHLDKHGCDLDEKTHESGSSDDHSSDGSLADDCCGDQCSSAQTLLPGTFNLRFTSSNRYDLVYLQWLPESIVAAESRPPINIS